MNFICTNDSNKLKFNNSSKEYYCPKCDSKYPVVNGVISFVDKSDNLYEELYADNTSTIKYLPLDDSWFSKLPLWFINSGYPWYIDKFVPKGSTLLELGCGSGIRFLGKNFKAIGLDLSLKCLINTVGVYEYCLKANGLNIPMENESVDAVVSSYFWEHIKEDDKITILNECKRVLKPGGLLVFLYDVETNNSLLSLLKAKNLGLYNKLFLEGDSHVGYQTPSKNKEIFNKANFQIIKHFGMERTWLQSHSVYKKLCRTTGMLKIISKCGLILNKKPFYYIHLFIVLIFDHTLGRMWSEEKSRIVITIAKNQAS